MYYSMRNITMCEPVVVLKKRVHVLLLYCGMFNLLPLPYFAIVKKLLHDSFKCRIFSSYIVNQIFGLVCKFMCFG